jgi:hypothetical protein
MLKLDIIKSKLFETKILWHICFQYEKPTKQYFYWEIFRFNKTLFGTDFDLIDKKLYKIFALLIVFL